MWATGGTVFLKSTFLVFLVIFLQTWAEIDARSLPKIFLTPRGARGASKRGAAGGTVFLKSAFLEFLVIFLQTWAEIDARNLPKNVLTPSNLITEVPLWKAYCVRNIYWKSILWLSKSIALIHKVLVPYIHENLIRNTP